MGSRVDRLKQKHSAPPEKRRGCGCVGGGCLALVILALALFAAAALLYRHVRVHYTSAAPAEFPAPPPSPADRLAAQRKLEAIGAAIRHQSAQTFRLSAHDLNALAADALDRQGIKGELAVQLGERLAVRFAFPLERVPGFRDRYLNGEADLSVGCENGVVEVFVRGVRANGRDLPAWMLRDLSRENFATRLYDRPDARDVLKRIAAIRLSDDGATLTTKGK